jgi:hypothetical protein
MVDVVTLVPLVLGLAGGAIPLVEDAIRKRFGREREESYTEKLTRLTNSLQKSSQDVDNLLKELASVAQARSTAVANLESEMHRLTAHEQELKKRVEDLQAVPIPVADHFAALVSKGERRSAIRDYLLFGLGVVVSTVIAVVLRLVGIG